MRTIGKTENGNVIADGTSRQARCRAAESKAGVRSLEAHQGEEMSVLHWHGVARTACGLSTAEGRYDVTPDLDKVTCKNCLRRGHVRLAKAVIKREKEMYRIKDLTKKHHCPVCGRIAKAKTTKTRKCLWKTEIRCSGEVQRIASRKEPPGGTSCHIVTAAGGPRKKKSDAIHSAMLLWVMQMQKRYWRSNASLEAK